MIWHRTKRAFFDKKTLVLLDFKQFRAINIFQNISYTCLKKGTYFPKLLAKRKFCQGKGLPKHEFFAEKINDTIWHRTKRPFLNEKHQFLIFTKWMKKKLRFLKILSLKQQKSW